MTAVQATCGNSVKGKKCGNVEEVDVDQTATEWWQFMARERNVQQLYPKLSNEEREILMGHRNGFGFLCSKCWLWAFGPEGDE